MNVKELAKKYALATLILVAFGLSAFYISIYKENQNRWESFFSSITIEFLGAIFLFLILQIFLPKTFTIFSDNNFTEKPNTEKSITENELTSNEWFDNIIENLRAAELAYIYLYSFEHPAQTKEIHKNQIIEIMDHFSRMILNSSPDNFKIVAYRPTNSTGNDPINYIKDKIRQLDNSLTDKEIKRKISATITVVSKQPTSNSCSAYVFQNNRILFSVKSDGVRKYYNLHFDGVIPHFLIRGLKAEYIQG